MLPLVDEINRHKDTNHHHQLVPRRNHTMAITNRDVTFPARLSFNDLFTPRAAQEGGTPKYLSLIHI